MTAVAEMLGSPEVQVLHPLIYEAAERYRNTPMAGSALVFGRGSIEFEDGSRWLSPQAEERVLAMGGFLLAHEDELVVNTVNEQEIPTFDVVWSCGWAAGGGQEAPDDFYREATMMEAYADALGILEYFKGRVRFRKQPFSSTTIGDGVEPARRGLLGRRPWDRFTNKNPLGVVSHVGESEGDKGHMGRCTDAARWAFRLKKNEILEIPAQGTDQSTVAASEKNTRRLTRIGTVGLHHTRHPEKLLRRDRLMVKANLFIGRLLSGARPDTQTVPENV